MADENPLKRVTETGETYEGLARQFAEAWRDKNWLRLLAWVLGAWILFANPPVLKTVFDFFSGNSLPDWYGTTLFIGVAAGLFVAMLAVAIKSPRPLPELKPIKVGESSIKGLLPFEAEDAETFTKLERETDLRECLSVLTAGRFRFGTLQGESGCGKTSLLRAGLLPRLNAPESRLRCVYVEFSDHDPFETVRTALATHLKLTEPWPQTDDLNTTLYHAAGDGKPLVLLFDQFEQFFLPRRDRLNEDPFVAALANWYRQPHPSAHRILFCLRQDFYFLTSYLEKAMGYAPGPQERIILEKLTPQQATRIFQVMATEMQLDFDESFVKQMSEQELAGSDGRISPVDVQILGWLMRGFKTDEYPSFNESSYQRLGGVDGLLERYLRRVLEPRGIQTDLKILLALTNLESNVRAGILSVETIRERTAQQLSEVDIRESLTYLSRADVRLIVHENQGYKLAHERMIPGLRRLAGNVLTDQDKANHLLDRRVNEWLANDRSRRFLLPWSEWRLIKRQQPFLIWGTQDIPKRDLLRLTAHRWRNRLVAALAVLVSVLLTYAALQTPWGQIQWMKYEVNAMKGSKYAPTQEYVAYTLTQMGQTNRGILIAHEQPAALDSIARMALKQGDTLQARAALDTALAASQGLSEDAKARVLPGIAQGFAQLKDTEQARAGLEKVLAASQGLSEDAKALVLSGIAQGFARNRAWRQARLVTNQLTGEAKAEALYLILICWTEPKANAPDLKIAK